MFRTGNAESNASIKMFPIFPQTEMPKTTVRGKQYFKLKKNRPDFYEKLFNHHPDNLTFSGHLRYGGNMYKDIIFRDRIIFTKLTFYFIDELV